MADTASILGTLRILVDADAAKAERTLASLGGKAGVAGKVVGGALSAGFAIAAKGSLEMENRQAAFQAATGASIEEAERFSDELNAMAGDSLVSMDNLAGAMTAIRTDLGLTGDAASAAADDFERYMRATGQGSDAVLAFDDILDAWNLDATKASGIMDILVKSHQLYGGAIADNQRNLGLLAPALQAANMTLEDGQALLNLFAASGVDGAASVAAFTKAVSSIEDPRELQALIDDLTQTEDATLRLQKAVDIFGARGGAKIADALGVASEGLDSFAVTAEDAFGTVDDAAAALDSTISSQVQLAINHAMSLVRGFGMELGPALTAAFSVASLGKMLGLDKVFGALFHRAQLAAAPAIAAAGTASSAAYAKGVLVGQKVMATVAAAWTAIGAAGSRVLVAAFGAGGLTAASYLGGLARGLTVVGIAAIVGEAVNEGLRQAGIEPRKWEDIVGVPALREKYFGDVLDEIEHGTDAMRAEIVTGTHGALSAAADAVEEGEALIGRAVVNVFGNATDAALESFKLAEQVEQEMRSAQQAILSGFGSIKDALKKESRPQLISRDDRLANMEKRQRRVQKQLNAAVEADDPWNQRYWEKAREKIELQHARLAGNDAKVKRILEARSAATADKAIRDGERIVDGYARLNLTGVGQSWMTTLTAGMASGLPGALAEADLIRNSIEERLRVNRPLLPPPTPGVPGTGTGGSSGGTRRPDVATGYTSARAIGGDTFHIGTLIANDSGIDELDRRIERRRKVRGRGPMRYADRD